MKWKKRFMELAVLISSWSKDPSTMVGAVIVDTKKRIISTGYNGFPAGTNDSKSLYSNRESKYSRTMHAEANAILFAKQDLSGFTIYITAPPCCNCAGMIIQSGISKVVCCLPNSAFLERWGDDLRISRDMLQEASVSLVMV